MQSILKCLEDIKNCRNIAIFTHKEPDTDAFASTIALKKLIKNNIENDDKIIDIFYDYQEVGELNGVLIKGVPHNVERCHKYDLGIALDCASLERIGKWQELFLSCDKKINFDHHLTNTKFADNNIVINTTSTCEALYLFAKAKDYKISDDICALVYSGIITDTNNLTQGHIAPRTHKIIADMMSRGVNLEALKEHFFKNNTKSKAYLLTKALESLKFYSKDRIAIMRLTKQDFIECDATKEDTFGIVNHGIDIKGVDIAILLIKQPDDSYYVSLRGKNNVNVAEIATKMGGGGHEQVAAFQSDEKFSIMFDKLLGICKEQLQNIPEEPIEDLFAGEEKGD